MSGGRIVQGSNLSRQNSFNFSEDASQDDTPPPIIPRPGINTHDSFGISKLDVEDKEEEEDLLKDPREWLKVIGAYEQPKMVYNIAQKHFDRYDQRRPFLVL